MFDIKAVSAVAKSHGLLAVDNLRYPYLQNPIDLAPISSCTRLQIHRRAFRHSDGTLMLNDDALAEQLFATAVASRPMDSFLVLRGIKTTPSMQRHTEN